MDSFWDKENETIEWVKSFEPQNTFFDVGANIGVYSLYAAALFSESLIYAFEPVKCNFMRLIQNIELNEFDNIIALPIGVSNISRVDVLLVKENIIGHSGSQFGTIGKEKPVKDYLVPIIALDDFEIFDIPTYLKIDIDGQEMAVINGALRILKNYVQSCLIEVNQDKEEIVKIFNAFGYTTDNRFNKFKNHSRVRRAKEGIKAENIIFTRR